MKWELFFTKWPNDLLHVPSTHNRVLVWCISPVPIPFSNPRDLLRASFPNPCGCADYPSTIVWLVVFSCAVFHLRGIRDTRAFKAPAPYTKWVLEGFHNIVSVFKTRGYSWLKFGRECWNGELKSLLQKFPISVAPTGIFGSEIWISVNFTFLIHKSRGNWK